MAHQINNQSHILGQLPMLQGLNFTILNQQQHHLGQLQPGHQGMYQIVQQVQPGQHQAVQLQNVQHQFNNQFQMQQQHFNQQQHILVQPQAQQLQPQIQVDLTQQLQQQTHQQIQHQQIQQQQPQTPQTPQPKTPQPKKSSKKAESSSNNNNSSNNDAANKSTSKKKRNIPKTNKDGVPAPKRATTAYINFTQFYRESIKKAGRTVPKIGEFGKECASKWNAMTEEEKKPFTDEAERDRERYRKEMEAFKPARDTNRPKRPGTAFMLFMVDFRKEIAGREPEGGVAALAKLGGERWRGMTEEEKKRYIDRQNECKVIYEQQMEDYRKLTGEPAPVSKKSKSKPAPTSVKSEESDNNSEHLNNSLSNSNPSHNNGNSVDQLSKLNNHDEQSHNHNSESPGSTSPRAAPNTTESTTTILQPSFYATNAFMTPNFLDQQQEEASSYSHTIDQQLEQQQLHDGQQNAEQAAYLQNGQQSYYGWN